MWIVGAVHIQAQNSIIRHKYNLCFNPVMSSCVRIRVLKSNVGDFVDSVGLHDPNIESNDASQKDFRTSYSMHSRYSRQRKYFNSLEIVYESELIEIGDYLRHSFCTLVLVTANPK